MKEKYFYALLHRNTDIESESSEAKEYTYWNSTNVMIEISFYYTVFSLLHQSAIQNDKNVIIAVDCCDFLKCIADCGSAIYSENGEVVCSRTCINWCHATTSGSSIKTNLTNVSFAQSSVVCCSYDAPTGDDVFDIRKGVLLVSEVNFSKNKALSSNLQSFSSISTTFSFTVITESESAYTAELYLKNGRSSMSNVVFSDNIANSYLIYFEKTSVILCSSSYFLGTRGNAKTLFFITDLSGITFSGSFYDGNINPGKDFIGLTNSDQPLIPVFKAGARGKHCQGFFGRLGFPLDRHGIAKKWLLVCLLPKF